MKLRIKRWMWKKFLMLLGALAWRLDEWVHAQQLKLRRELERGKAPVSIVHTTARRAGSTPASRSNPVQFRSASTHSEPAAEIPVAGYHHRQPESFDEWTKRRAGVAPASKAEARRHRERLTAAAFDRRFAS